MKNVRDKRLNRLKELVVEMKSRGDKAHQSNRKTSRN